jgi:N-acetylglutamate synthase-like GNAT family acetyltransferase
VAIEIKVVSGYAELERWVAARNEVATDDSDTVALKALLRASQDGRVDLIAYDRGEVVGTGLMAGDPGTLRSSHPYVEVMVPDRHRGRGVGTALLQDVSDRLRRLGKEGLQVGARSDDLYSLGYLERRGFVEVDRWSQLFLELDALQPVDQAPPPGIEVVWLADRPDLLEAMFSLAVETGRDQTGSFEAWQAYELGDPRIRLDLTPIAVAEDEVIGYGTLMELVGDRTGCHRYLTFPPRWQERGVCAALMHAQISGAKAAGLETLFAWARPEEHQPFYESLGYEARIETIEFQGPLQ